MKFELQGDDFTGDVTFQGSLNLREALYCDMNRFELMVVESTRWDDPASDILRTLAILFEVYERAQNEEKTK